MAEAGSSQWGGVMHDGMGSLSAEGRSPRNGGGLWGRVSMSWRQDYVPEWGGTVGGAELGPVEEELRVTAIRTSTGNGACP